MKLAVVLAAFVSAFSFSSCLNNDNTSSSDWLGYATVKENSMTGMAYLAGDDGIELIPVSSSVLAPLKLTDGSYYKRVLASVKFLEGELVEEGKKSYKISELVSYQGLNYKGFNLRPDTLEKDYPIVAIEGIWAKNGYVNLPFSFKTNTNLSTDDFHMYAVDAKEDTLYTRFRQTKGDENAYNKGTGLISFSMPFNSEYYYKLQPENDSIVIKVTAPGENNQTLTTTVKYRYNER